MFNSIKNTMVNKKFVRLLGLIVAASTGTPGYAFVEQKDAEAMHASEPTFLLADANTKDGSKIAVKASDAGVAAWNAAQAAPAASAAPKPVYTLESNIPIPAKNRGGRTGQSVYPFAQMEVGQSFFIPKSAERPDPAKSMTSTVSAATRKFAKKIDGETVVVKGRKGRPDSTRPKTEITRKFEVREVEGGARVFRTQ